MRNKTSLWKRSLAALLSLVMVLGMVPTFGLAPAAHAAGEEGDTTEGDSYQGPAIEGNYITLPITIRDFAADGMLFEYNEVYRQETTTYYETDYAAYTAQYNPWYWDLNSTNGSAATTQDFTGIRIYTAGYAVYDDTYDQTETAGSGWYVLILNANGDIIKVLDLLAEKWDVDEVIDNTTGAAYSLWAWRDSSNTAAYTLLEGIYNEYQTVLAKELETKEAAVAEAAAIQALGKYRFGISNVSGTEDATCTLFLGTQYHTTYDDMISNGHKGIYLFAGDAIVGQLGALDNYNAAWTAIVARADTNVVVDVVPKISIDGTENENPDRKSLALSGYVNENFKIVMVWDTLENATFRDMLAGITDDTASEYTIVEETSSMGANVLYIERTRTFNEADTKAFGLLKTTEADYLDVLSGENTIGGTEFVQNGTYGSEDAPEVYKSELWDMETHTTYATQDIYGANVRTNLVDRYLDANGNPQYTKETVEFLAEFMHDIMAVEEKNADGSYNSYFVTGTKLFDATWSYIDPNSPEAIYTLADLIRFTMETYGWDVMGTYEESKAKFETISNPAMGTSALEYVYLARSWCDVAYYLLHSTWRDSLADNRNPGTDGYGFPIARYDSIHLVERKNTDGSVYYTFNARYEDSVYDYDHGEIYNTQTNTYSHATLDGEPFYTYGNALPEDRFDPIGPSGAGVNQGYGMNGNTYGDMVGASATQSWGEYYDNTNYNLSLEGHAQFVYHQDANQYFTFTGDDDVYLYINGTRVLDIGAAHSIAKVQININDIAEVCGLRDGETYAFDFFYMERHGTAANFGIETNIQLAEPSLSTTKTGYQGGSSTGYNGFVDPNVPVAYSFTVKNDGDAAIKNLIFDDREIGIYFAYDDVQLYPEGEAEEDHCYSIDDMYLYVFNPNGSVKEVYSQGNLTEAIIKRELTQGLQPGESLGIYGFKYRIPSTSWKNETVTVNGKNEDHTVFINTVTTTGTSVSTGKLLHAVSDWKVQKTEEQLNKFHVYDWVAQTVSRNPNNEEANRWYSPDGATVTVTVEEILERTIDTAKYPNATVVPCTASGNTSEFNLNQHITLNKDADGKLLSMTYTSTIPGVDQVYYKVINADKDALVFNYRVFTYGAVDSIYVLDYGLNVELNGPKFGLLANDHLNVVGSPATAKTIGVSEAIKNFDTEKNLNVYTYDPEAEVLDEAFFEGDYGDFDFGEEKTWVETLDEDADETEEPEEVTYLSLMYKPKAIINNTDALIAHIEVREEGYDPAQHDLKFYGVDMHELVTTAPANVVYYEENFPGITYVNEGENQWVHYETTDEDGKSVAGTEQSADQNSNYGSDPNYGAPADDETNMDEYTGGDKIGVLDSEGPVVNTINLNLDTSDLNALQASGIDALNEYFGLGGGDSNGTVNKLVVNQTAEVMYFDFTGTGFELISRTTMEEYAVINVQVQKKNEDGTYTVVRQMPVITESKGGDLYQIPIISITGLPKDNYHVVVQAGTTGNVTRVFYVDGIRIYGPLDNNQALEYYNPAEYRAEIFEVKQLIEDGAMFYADLGVIDDVLQFDTGSTMVENTDEGAVLVPVYDVYEYMTVGPNNELYMDGNSVISVLTFTITPVENYPDPARTLQIGAHRKANSNSDDMGAAVLTYSSDYQEIYERSELYMYEFLVDGTNSYSIASGTEMYYTIDVDNLIEQEDGSYLVMIAAIGSEAYGTNLALTNLKVAGYTITNAEATLLEADENGTVDQEPMVVQTFGLLRAVRDLIAAEPEVEQIPVNENLTINSAGLSAAKVVSGRTATLTVKAGEEAQTLVLVDSQGNEVTATRCTRKVSKGVATFTFIWKVTGTSGQALNYTVRVYDADGLASVNTESITVTIR